MFLMKKRSRRSYGTSSRAAGSSVGLQLRIQSKNMKRARQRYIGILGVIALLFAQLFVSAYACPLAGRVAPTSVAANSPGTMVDMGALDVDQPNACLGHCKGDSTTSVHQPQPPILLAPIVIGLLVPVVDIRLPLQSRALPEPDAEHLTAPPPSILFCVLRT